MRRGISKKKWVPRKGQMFKSRDEVEEKLLEAKWEFEGHEISFAKGKTSGFNVGMVDRDTWLMVDMVPYREGVKITRVRRLKK